MTKIIVEYNQDSFSSKVECTKEGQKISIDGAYGYEIVCPDPRVFCEKSGVLNCENDCNGRGSCKSDKTCFCDIMFQSTDCSETVQCEDELCKKLIQTQSIALIWVLSDIFLIFAFFMFLFLDY